MIFTFPLPNGKIFGMMKGRETQLLVEYLTITYKLLEHGIPEEDVKRAMAAGLILYRKEASEDDNRH